ncbi:oligoribonuclease [compost metagenome]
MSRLLFIDCETGGLDPQVHSLLTVGMAVYDTNTNQITGELDLQIKHKDYIVTPEALRVNKLDLTREVQCTESLGFIGVATPLAACMSIVKFINLYFDDKPIVAGHNVAFDIDFIGTQLFDNEYCHPLSEHISHRKVDTQAVVQFLVSFGRLDLSSSSLEKCLKYFKIETKEEDRHTALGDVKSTIKLYESLKQFVSNRDNWRD